MKRRLSIEDHIVAISHMSLDNITNVQSGICVILLVSKVSLDLIARSDDKLGSWPFVGPISHELSHIIFVGPSDVLRNGQVLGNLFRHTKLVQL